MSHTPPESFKVAAVQASPVFLDRDATVAKACALIEEAGRLGARLAVFPETFIPAYPDWVWHVPVSERALLNGLDGELLDQSVTVPGDVTNVLGDAARRASVHAGQATRREVVARRGGPLRAPGRVPAHGEPGCAPDDPGRGGRGLRRECGSRQVSTAHTAPERRCGGEGEAAALASR